MRLWPLKVVLVVVLQGAGMQEELGRLFSPEGLSEMS